MDEVQRGFRGIWITAELWEDRTLSIHAKVLWSEIHSLSKNRNGWCFASDAYLMDLIQLGRSRFYEIIKELKDCGRIEVTMSDSGKIMRRTIEIYSPENRTTNPGSRTVSIRDPGLSSDIYNKEYNKEKKDKEKESAVALSKEKAPPPLPTDKILKKPYGEFKKVLLSEAQYLRSVKRFGEKRLLVLIEGLDGWLASNGKVKKDYEAALRVWHANEKKFYGDKAEEKENLEEKNKELSIRLLKKYPNHPHIKLGVNYLEFIFGQRCDYIKFNENGFEERVIANLRKMKLSL